MCTFRGRKYQEEWPVCAENKVDTKTETYLQIKKSPKRKPSLIYYTTFNHKTS